MLALDGLPSLELSIVPASELVPVYPTSGFVLFDDDRVVIETVTGEQEPSDPAEVTKYNEWFELLRKASVRGREARHLIQAALADLTGQQQH